MRREDRWFGILLAVVVVASVIWIVVALLNSADLDSGQAGFLRYALLLGLAGLLGFGAAHFFGEDKGVGVFLAAVFTGASIWILVALFGSVHLSVQGRANFGYVLFIGIPIAVGFGLTMLKDSRERAAAE